MFNIVMLLLWATEKQSSLIKKLSTPNIIWKYHVFFIIQSLLLMPLFCLAIWNVCKCANTLKTNINNPLVILVCDTFIKNNPLLNLMDSQFDHEGLDLQWHIIIIIIMGLLIVLWNLMVVPKILNSHYVYLSERLIAQTWTVGFPHEDLGKVKKCVEKLPLLFPQYLFQTYHMIYSTLVFHIVLVGLFMFIQTSTSNLYFILTLILPLIALGFVNYLRLYYITIIIFLYLIFMLTYHNTLPVLTICAIMFFLFYTQKIFTKLEKLKKQLPLYTFPVRKVNETPITGDFHIENLNFNHPVHKFLLLKNLCFYIQNNGAKTYIYNHRKNNLLAKAMVNYFNNTKPNTIFIDDQDITLNPYNNLYYFHKTSPIWLLTNKPENYDLQDLMDFIMSFAQTNPDAIIVVDHDLFEYFPLLNTLSNSVIFIGRKPNPLKNINSEYKLTRRELV